MQDLEIVFLTNAASELEGKIICAKLESYGIRAMLQDKESGEYIKVIMGTLAFGVDIYVRVEDFERAYEIVFDSPGTFVDGEFENSLENNADIKTELGEYSDGTFDENEVPATASYTNISKILWIAGAIGVLLLLMYFFK